MQKEATPSLDLIKSFEWFLGTICGQVDNHEIATAIVAAGFVAVAILRAGVGKMAPKFADLVSNALTPKILLATLALSVYSALLYWLAWSIGLWSAALLLDSILEVAFVGLPTLLIACRATSMKSVLGELVLPEVKFAALVGFYLNLECLSILGEIVMQAMGLFAALVSVLGDRTTYPKIAKGIAGILFAVIGVTMFANATNWLLASWGDIDWMEELRSLGLSIWYPVGMLPFVWALGLYSAFEQLWIRGDCYAGDLSIASSIHLIASLSMKLRYVKHFTRLEARAYSQCSTWREEALYLKGFKEEVDAKADDANAKVKRMRAGVGKRGFDEEGIWLDWTSLEKMKTSLWTIAADQNGEWKKNGHYNQARLKVMLESFTPDGCTGDSSISVDSSSYACWLTSPTGFVFGMGSSGGSYPPLRYEGDREPDLKEGDLLAEFVSDEDESSLPNWNMKFWIDESFR